jgi:hypothetical protein
VDAALYQMNVLPGVAGPGLMMPKAVSREMAEFDLA